MSRLSDLQLAQFEGRLRQRFGPQQIGVSRLKNLYKGMTLLVLANGPSLNDVPYEAFERFPTFGSNGIFLKLVPDIYITISKEFYLHYPVEIGNLRPRLKLLGSQLRGKNLVGSADTIFLPTVFPENAITSPYDRIPNPIMFSRDPTRVVYLGGTVLFAQLQLALFMGVSRVLIAGLDHNFGLANSDRPFVLQIDDNDRYHFDSKYLPRGAKAHVDMAASERAFNLAFRAFRRAGVEIWNVTPDSELDILPIRDISTFLKS